MIFFRPRPETRRGWCVRAAAVTALAAAVLILEGAAAAVDPAGDMILGRWETEGGKGIVELTRAGASYCGTLCGLSEPCYPADDKCGMGGKPKVDRDNPDPALRTRPVLGLQILHGFTYAGDNTWQGGSIYDPESGNTYRSKLALRSDGTLQVRGYIGIALFGRTTVWKRLP